MANKNKNNTKKRGFSEKETIEISPFQPVCKFKKGSMSPAFEKALDAVEQMEKNKQN